MSTVQLQRGEYFGTTTARGEAPGALLSCLRHAAARKLPVHAHESAFFTMLLRGHYRERAGSREIHYDPLTVVFHPPSFAHLDEIGAGDSVLVTVEVARSFFEEYHLALPSLAQQSFEAARRLLKMYAAARAGLLTPLDVESGVLELVADATKMRDIAELAVPPWLPRALERLHAVDAPFRVRELAREANVHPVHFTRVFRRRVGTTPGAYLQRVRLQCALRLLATGRSLADVAVTSGFADQSHFCRAVRAALGLSPRPLATLLRTAALPPADPAIRRVSSDSTSMGSRGCDAVPEALPARGVWEDASRLPQRDVRCSAPPLRCRSDMQNRCMLRSDPRSLITVRQSGRES